MRWFCVYPLAIAILSSNFVAGQGNIYDPCTATDGSPTGPAGALCASGYCRYGGCSDPANIARLGEVCTNEAQCIDAETFSDTPAYCSGLPGLPSSCGGAEAFCFTENGGGTGTSPTCASNSCKGNQCGAVNALPVGGACGSDIECEGFITCISGTCNDFGQPCTADDLSATGVSSQCSTGFCRQGACPSYPSSTIGEQCGIDGMCIGAETFSETPPYCAGAPGTTATCGGASAFCYETNGGATGPSVTCASNVCKSNQCVAVDAVPSGGTCQFDYECVNFSRCISGTCNDVGFPCEADADGSSTGPSDLCDTGYCRQGGCASFPASALGEPCASDSSCVGVETFGDTPAYCAGVPGTQATCGGPSAFCYTDVGGATGVSATCASNICKSNQCAALVGVPPGGSCSFNFECRGYANCNAGTCNDVGFPCQATADGSSTGPSDQCDIGYCRQGGCASFPASGLGEACSSDSSCIGVETFGETPAYCAGVPGTQATCGGPSAFCYTDVGGSTGVSATCASNICKSNQCAALVGVPPGGSCTSNFECQGYANCVQGTCNDLGFPCQATDLSNTGPSDQCDTGYCRQGGCASFPASRLGEACLSDSACINAETFGDTPAYCAGPAGVSATCGGGSAFCYTLEGGSTGFSPTCASGQCVSNQCRRVDPVAPGGVCQGSFDCGGGIACVSGFCTGGEDTCAADDNNGQAIGTSDDCTSGFCRAGQCSNVPAAVLGDICGGDRDCSGFEDNTVYRSLLNCGQSGSGTRRCGSGGAYCVSVEGSPSGSAPALCISGQCLNYACTDVTPTPGLRKRADSQVQQIIQTRLCPKGFEPCPLFPKGYECVDVLNDIESCGGCVGRNMPGIDCSADVHAAEVSCISGRCLIAACETGYVVASENNTCVAA